MFRTLVACCCPTEDDHNDEDGERTRLIRNGTSSHGGGRYPGAYGSSSTGVDNMNGPAVNAADDEQAILAQILQDTANNVIDISTADVHTVEPREYMERARKYNQRLSSQITAASLEQATAGAASSTTTRTGSSGKRASISSGHQSAASTIGASRCLLTDSTLTASGGATLAPADKLLSGPPTNVDDLLMIRQLSSQMGRVVTDIHVDHKEDLVAQFVPA